MFDYFHNFNLFIAVQKNDMTKVSFQLLYKM